MHPNPRRHDSCMHGRGARASCARSQASQQTHLGRSSSRRCDLHRPQAAMHFHLHWHRHWRPLQTRAPTLSNVASACPGPTALGDPTGPAQVLGSTLSSRPPRLLWLHTCSSHFFRTTVQTDDFVAWGRALTHRVLVGGGQAVELTLASGHVCPHPGLLPFLGLLLPHCKLWNAPGVQQLCNPSPDRCATGVPSLAKSGFFGARFRVT